MTKPGRLPGGESQNYLFDIAEEFIRLHEEGEITDLDAYCARYPEALQNGARRECEQILRVRGIMRQRGRLIPGQKLGPYRIIELIGLGGMGEVYRARDGTLGRDVAIKILPPHLACQTDRVERFELEARAVAAIDHSNIVTIHSVERAGDIPFLTMQLVEGEILSAKIPQNGLNLEEFFTLAIPMVDAISTAHEHGIVHRDLKPANIMVTRDGGLKVLDFGLAKLREDVAAGSNDDRAGQPLTEAGAIVGTTAYMSPEQAEGTRVDHRSDVFNLGIILYEMATGRRPFGGDTRVAQMASIVNDTPAPVRPHDLGRLIHRALEKAPEHRYQTARDLTNELVELKRQLSSGEVDLATIRSAVRPPRHWPRWLAAGATLALIVLLVDPRSGGQPKAAGIPFKDDLPTEFRLTGGPGRSEAGYDNSLRPTLTAIDVSPDELSYVISATNDQTYQLFKRSLTEIPRQPQLPIPGTDYASAPFYKPDGKKIGFLRESFLWTILVDGEEPKKLVGPIDRFRGAHWGDDGFIYYSDAEKGMFKVRENGGEPEQVTFVDAPDVGEHTFPHVLPRGRALIYTSRPFAGGYEAREIWVKRLPNGEAKHLITNGMDGKYSNGHLVFTRLGVPMVIPFNVDTLDVRDEARPLLNTDLKVVQSIGAGDNILTDTGAAQLALSGATIVYAVDDAPPWEDAENLMYLESDQDPIKTVETSDRYLSPRLSPRGDRLAAIRGPPGNPDIVVYELESKEEFQMKLDGLQGSPVFNPGGTALAFFSNHQGVPEVYRVEVADILDGRINRGEEIPTPITSNRIPQGVRDWSDADTILVSEGGRDNPTHLVIIDATTGDEVRRFTPDEKWRSASLSLDGQWLAIESPPFRGIQVRSIDNPGWHKVFVDELSHIRGSGPKFSRRPGDHSFFFHSRGDENEYIWWRFGYSILDNVFEPGPLERVNDYPDSDQHQIGGETMDLGWDVGPRDEILVRHALNRPALPVRKIEVILNFPLLVK